MPYAHDIEVIGHNFVTEFRWFFLRFNCLYGIMYRYLWGWFLVFLWSFVPRHVGSVE
jgi:hypothetical protein